MNRLASAFAKGRPALVCFITAGDGDTAANLDALVEGGADVIELGMPFTDPMADGPAIQAANLRSLGKGTTTRDVLAIAEVFRERHPDVPLVLMGYANPMVRRGAEWFADEAKSCGVDGVICVDLPPEEDEELGPALRAAGLDLIRLATPTTARRPSIVPNAAVKASSCGLAARACLSRSVYFFESRNLSGSSCTSASGSSSKPSSSSCMIRVSAPIRPWYSQRGQT